MTDSAKTKARRDARIKVHAIDLACDATADISVDDLISCRIRIGSLVRNLRDPLHVIVHDFNSAGRSLQKMPRNWQAQANEVDPDKKFSKWCLAASLWCKINNLPRDPFHFRPRSVVGEFYAEGKSAIEAIKLAGPGGSDGAAGKAIRIMGR